MPSNGDGAEQSNDEATRQDSPPARSDSQPAAANTDMSSADGVRSNGGFYRPSLSAETTSTTAGNLDSAIEHMRQALNEVGKEETSNEERAKRMFRELVPSQNSIADERRKEYRYEYGPALFSNKDGCSCYCGKCSMSQDLSFIDMRTYLYTTPSTGETEVILTSNRLHFQALEANGAVLVPWTAFGSAHTQEHISEKCPPLRSNDDEDEDEDDNAPSHDLPVFHAFALSALPSLQTVNKHGLPPVRLVKGTAHKWTVKTLNAFMETPFDLNNVRFPPATLWPLAGAERNRLYRKFITHHQKYARCGNAKSDEFGDQVLKNAFKIYSILHMSPDIHQTDDLELDESLYLKKHITQPAGLIVPHGASQWACIARSVANSRVVQFNANFYEK